MKKTYKFIFAMAISILAFAACQKEIDKFDDVNKTVEVVVSMSEVTKSFTDAGAIKWDVGDILKFSDGTIEFSSNALVAANITNNGYTAAFTFPSELNSVSRQGWFYTANTHTSNYTDVLYPNSFTQAAAGEMNKDYLFLHSGGGLINIVANDPIPPITMIIEGSIYRIIPYAADVWTGESIISVKLESNSNIAGTVVLDRALGGQNITGLTSKSIEVNLGTPYSIASISNPDLSKGIYIPVPKISLIGYKITIDTDKATYTFDAMSTNVPAGSSVVKNMLLNVNHTSATRSEGLITIDGSYDDWDAIEPTKVAECTSNVPGSALQKMKVYADKRYINVYFEYDTAQIDESSTSPWTLTRFFFNSDNDTTTGGGYWRFLGKDKDIMVDGACINGGIANFWPALYLWNGVNGESTWTWKKQTIEGRFGSGAGGLGKYELQIELLTVKNQGVVFADEFTIGMYIEQNAVKAVLPNGAGGAAAEKLSVTIDK